MAAVIAGLAGTKHGPGIKIATSPFAMFPFLQAYQEMESIQRFGADSSLRMRRGRMPPCLPDASAQPESCNRDKAD